MSTAAQAIVCIDVGGTGIKSGLLENGRLTDVAETPTPAEGGEGILRVVAGIAARYPGAGRIGVSTAGEVDAAKGVVRYAVNIPGYSGMAVGERLRGMTGLPAALENDVNAAAIGELHFGAGHREGLRDFIMVSYGTGIGGAVIVNGALLRGASGSAGEIGGLITHAGDVADMREGSGSYERYAATTSLVEKARRLSPDLCNGRAVFAAMNRADVRGLVAEWVEEIACGLVGAIHLLNPQAVVLGGGILREDVLHQAIAQRVLPMLKPTFAHTKILKAQLGGEASLYGAGFLAAALPTE